MPSENHKPDTASANPEIVRAWVEGWAIARGTTAPVAVEGGFRIDVGWPDQRVRYVFPALNPTRLHDLAASLKPPAAFIKVCCAPGLVSPLLPVNWVLQDPRYMMTLPLSGAGARGEAVEVPIGYRVTTERDGAVITVALYDDQNNVAANGSIALNGRYAIVDQIGTHVDHRRRGLGR